MTESQRETTPRNDAGERDTALAFLAFARHCAIKKTDGLSEDELRRVLVPSGTSLLGLIQHLTVTEHWWFGQHFGPTPDDPPDDEWDFGMAVPATTTAAEVLAAYRRAIADSDAVIAALPDLEARTTKLVDGQTMTLRWVLAHVTSEIARHAGHADILRELIDGVTGR